MKLLLQLLFAQGWLWRYRSPERFAQAEAPGRRLDWSTAPPALAAALGIGVMATGDSILGPPLLAIGLSFLAWRLSALGLTKRVRFKELRISASWTAGFVLFAVSLGFAVFGVAVQRWQVLFLSLVALLFLSSRWIQQIQMAYLTLRYPADNMWRLEGSQVGIIRQWTNLWLDAYWRLPRQILFPKKERHAQ